MKPKTRLENFLAKIAGNKDAKELKPKTRLEHFLNDIADNGGCSGGGEGNSGGEIEIVVVGEGTFVLSEIITMSELYNKVANGARIYITVTMPEQESIIVHEYKMYFQVQMVNHVTINGNERRVVSVFNKQTNTTLYLYNDAGSNEVIISEHAPG